MARYQETSTICLKCKGSCFNLKDPVATQQTVLKKYGMIANKCVNDANGAVKCPYTEGSH